MNSPLPRIAQTLANLDLVSLEDLAPIAQDTQGASEFLQRVFQLELISSKDLSKDHLPARKELICRHDRPDK